MNDSHDLQYAGRELAALIEHSRKIVVLTGAGVSTNAGIPDFRGPKGLYVTRQYDAHKVFDVEHFLKDAKPFYDFARDFLELTGQIAPTITHTVLAKLEERGNLLGVITQNIDSLHQAAGSKNVVELHGSFQVSHCLKCQQEFPIGEMRTHVETEVVPRCHCGGLIKPDIVFFGEDVKGFSTAAAMAHESDLFLVIGTSCAVQPAGRLPHLASGDIVVINQGEVELELYNMIMRIHSDSDLVMSQVAETLGMKLE